MQTSSKWTDLIGEINKLDMKILEDSIYIKLYKEKTAELDKKIESRKREIKMMNDHIAAMTPQAEFLRKDYEINLERIPLMQQIASQLAEANTLKVAKMKAEVAEFEEILSKRKLQYRKLKEEYELRTPGYKEYNEARIELKKLEFQEMLMQHNEQGEKQRAILKKDINDKLRNKTIVELAKRYVSYKNNEKLVKEIKEKSESCEVLMQRYQDHLLRSDSKMFQLTTDPKLPKHLLEIEELQKRKVICVDWKMESFPKVSDKMENPTPKVIQEVNKKRSSPFKIPQTVVPPKEIVSETAAKKIPQEKTVVEVIQQHIIPPAPLESEQERMYDDQIDMLQTLNMSPSMSHIEDCMDAGMDFENSFITSQCSLQSQLHSADHQQIPSQSKEERKSDNFLFNF